MEKPTKALSGFSTPEGWTRSALVSGMALGLMLGCAGSTSKPAAPTITSVTPMFGYVDSHNPTTITVNGSGFVSGVSSLNVSIGSILTTNVILSSDAKLTCQVPASAETAQIKVATDGGTAATPTNFVVWPWISTIVATSTTGGIPEGAPGTTVTVNGWGLKGVNAILFGTPNPTTIPDTDFTLDTANAIAFRVPTGFSGSTSFTLQQDNGLTSSNALVVTFVVN